MYVPWMNQLFMKSSSVKIEKNTKRKIFWIRNYVGGQIIVVRIKSKF